ncbi:YjdF family protein [Huintestinicola sp.]|uniref:YjdF family protein n=1 Tax=Huintestinicola sp. TaxID=2981661 RepID=UPI003D7CE748
MDKTTGKLEVFFEDPFWVGVFELYSEGKLTVSKVTFGAEPKDGEVYDFILHNYYRLKFSPPIKAEGIKESPGNPKRLQREIRKECQKKFIGTKSQQALKLQHEQFKAERQAVSREQKEAEKQRRFDLKQQKRKEKHKGR